MCTRTIILLLTLFSAGIQADGYRLTLEQQVYEALFLEVVGDAVTPLVVHKYTEAPRLRDSSVESILETYPDLVPVSHLIEELIESSKNPKELDWKPIMVSATIVELPEPRGTDEFWQHLRNKYQVQAYYSVSEVYVDRTTLNAVVYFHNDCGVLCGIDYVAYFRKSGAVWELVTGGVLRIS